MKKWFFLFSFIALFSRVSAQELPEQARQEIMATMAQQEKCWNEGDLECFMQGYWKSDSLRFIGSRGLTYGWQTTLDNYRKSYPDTEAMGKLTFDIISVEALGKNQALVLGQWALERKGGNLSGYYSLLWKKIDGQWKIVMDHSS